MPRIRISFLILAAFFLAFGASCSKSKKGSPGELENVNSNKYGLESGVVTLEVEILNPSIKTKQTLSFDDFGNLEARETTTEALLTENKSESHGKTIYKENILYTLNMDAKSYTQMSLLDPNFSEIDFSKIGRSGMRDYSVEEVGAEDILGRPCTIYKVHSERWNLTGKYWVWKNIPLKSLYNAGGMDVRMIATGIEEGTAIPPSMFDVPKGFKHIP